LNLNGIEIELECSIGVATRGPKSLGDISSRDVVREGLDGRFAKQDLMELNEDINRYIGSCINQK
jgi:hypothetical protein